ncbi:MAG: hypothetical protein SXV54_20620 [Chloroflexota bacterium]|nr:hypothetical protein [Chloroflexota bacterium]
MKRVAVLTIDHRHGTNVYVCKGSEVAASVLAQYVRKWWNENDLGEQPADDWETIDTYFDTYLEETYEIHDLTVLRSLDDLSGKETDL